MPVPLQHYDIGGTFLDAYRKGIEQQEQSADREFTRKRLARADERTEINFSDEQQAKNAAKVAQIAWTLDNKPKWDAFFANPQNLVEFGLPQGFTPPPFEMRNQVIARAQSIGDMQSQANADRTFGLQERKFGLDQQIARANMAQSYAAARASNARAAASAAPGAGVTPDGESGAMLGGESTMVVPNPYARMETPAQRGQMARAQQTSYQKMIGEAGEAARAAGGLKAQANQFTLLNERFKQAGGKTGGYYDWPVLGTLAEAKSSFDPNFQGMQAITAKLAPNMRPPGSGATSDFDAKQFVRATMSISKDQEANKRIAQAMSAQADRDVGYAQFIDWYFQKTGTTQGIQQAWLEYVNANPIFDQSDEDGFAVNRGAKSWQQFFGAGAGGARAPAAPPPAAGAAPTAPGTASPQQSDWSIRRVR
jgi:hypothetical protein